MSNVEFILGDCEDHLSAYPDNHFDLAIVDPPYGIGQPKQANLKGYNGRASLDERLSKNRLNREGGKLKDRQLNKSNCSWDDAIPSDDYFKELFRVSKNQIIWGGNYYNLPPTRCVICWDKVQPWTNFSQWEMAWTSFDFPARIFKFDNRTGDKIHPTQKPVMLYRWLLQNYAKEGDKIIDTHVGSGSSLIAAWEEGFDITGFEIDEDYYEAAMNRLNNYRRQYKLEF